MEKPSYGHRFDPVDRNQWILDKVLIIKALYSQQQGRPLPEHPYHWAKQTKLNNTIIGLEDLIETREEIDDNLDQFLALVKSIPNNAKRRYNR